MTRRRFFRYPTGRRGPGTGRGNDADVIQGGSENLADVDQDGAEMTPTQSVQAKASADVDQDGRDNDA